MKQEIAVKNLYLSLRQEVVAVWHAQGLHMGRDVLQFAAGLSACGFRTGDVIVPQAAELAQVRLHFLAQGVAR